MVAYKKAVEYRNSIVESIGALKTEREKFEKEVEALAKETTTPEALLKGKGAEFKRLKEAQQELTILNERLKAIEEQGGANGILRIDPMMKEFSDAVFSENKEQLEQLVIEKESLLKRLSDIFNMVEQLERDVTAHNNEVTRLENEIDTFKPFMTVVLSPKVSYKYHEAHFSRQYQTFFNDFRNVKDVWKRQKVGGVANE